MSREQTAGIDVGSLLLSRIADLGADLLVMGAYGPRACANWCWAG